MWAEVHTGGERERFLPFSRQQGLACMVAESAISVTSTGQRLAAGQPRGKFK